MMMMMMMSLAVTTTTMMGVGRQRDRGARPTDGSGYKMAAEEIGGRIVHQHDSHAMPWRRYLPPENVSLGRSKSAQSLFRYACAQTFEASRATTRRMSAEGVEARPTLRLRHTPESRLMQAVFWRRIRSGEALVPICRPCGWLRPLLIATEVGLVARETKLLALSPARFELG